MKEIGNGLKKMFVEYIFYSTCALIKMIYCVGCNSRDQKSRMWKKFFLKHWLFMKFWLQVIMHALDWYLSTNEIIVDPNFHQVIWCPSGNGNVPDAVLKVCLT